MRALLVLLQRLRSALGAVGAHARVRVRRKLCDVLAWLLGRLRDPEDDFEIQLDEGDLELATLSAARRLENWSRRRSLEGAYARGQIPKPPLAKSFVRSGWTSVGGATILGLGVPFVTEEADNRRPRQEEISWRTLRGVRAPGSMHGPR